MAEARRPCSKCSKNRAERFFVSERGRVCSTCRKASSRGHSRNARLQATYGISQADYEALRAVQGDACAGCGGWRKVYDIDHDHALEKQGVMPRHTVRGLLCRSCNKTLAVVRDKPERLRALADYLERGVVWPDQA